MPEGWKNVPEGWKNMPEGWKNIPDGWKEIPDHDEVNPPPELNSLHKEQAWGREGRVGAPPGHTQNGQKKTKNKLNSQI